MQAKMSNNGEARLASPIDTDDTTLYLQSGQGALFRPLSAGEWTPLTIINSAGNFEIVKATALAGDTFTIERHQEGTTARAFSAGDRVQNRLTAAVIDEIDSDLAGLSAEAAEVAANIQKQLYTAFTSAGVAPTFTLTPVPAITAYATGQRFRVKFHAAGSGADTLNVSGLGAKSIKQYNSVGAKVAAVIASGQLADVEYDGVDFVVLDVLPGASQPGFRNKINNGRMDVAQRGTSFAAIATGAYSVDRWGFGNTSAAVLTASQQADGPNYEFPTALRLAVTTADTAIATGDQSTVGQVIEGYNVRDLIGRSFTLSFWARSSKTGTHCVSFRNSTPDRSYVAEYTINAANTWEFKVITVAGGLPTAGTWDWANGAGLRVSWALAAGSTYQAAAGAWQAGNFLATANQVNCLDTVGNIFAITGVQLEVGATATPFEHRQYGAELALAQRYYEMMFMVFGTTTNSAQANFRQVKRSSPTMAYVAESGTGATLILSQDLVYGAYQSAAHSAVTRARVSADAEVAYV